MRAIHQGAADLSHERDARRARIHCRSRRRRTAARIAHLIGVIVAGGGSARFGGEPKGLLLVDGTRIIDRVAAALRPVTDELLLVANAATAGAWLSNVRVVRDRLAIRGSLVGIHTALAEAKGADVVVVAWDMPFVTADLLAAIAARLTPGVSAAVPEGVHGLEPFCAAYAAKTLDAVDAAITREDLRVARLLNALPGLRRVSADEVSKFGSVGRLFFNVNTPADLSEAERMARGD